MYLLFQMLKLSVDAALRWLLDSQKVRVRGLGLTFGWVRIKLRLGLGSKG